MDPPSQLERVSRLQLFWQVLGRRECDLPAQDLLTLFENAAHFGGTTLDTLLTEEEAGTCAAVSDVLAHDRIERVFEVEGAHAESNFLPTEAGRVSPAAEQRQWSKKRLGEILVELGVIDPQQLAAALEYQRWHRCKIGVALRELEFASEEQILTTLARKLGYERIDLDSLQLTPNVEAALRLVPKDIAVRKGVVPVACDKSTLTVALLDPANIEIVDELAFRSGRRIRVLVAGEGEVTRTVAHLYSGKTAFLDLELATAAAETQLGLAAAAT
jgi:hypothetical protein